jgi:hypothetical protein
MTNTASMKAYGNTAFGCFNFPDVVSVIIEKVGDFTK